MNEINRAPMTAAFYWSERLLDRVERAIAQAEARGVPLWRRRLTRWLTGERPRTLLRRESFCGRQTLQLDSRGVTHRGESFEIALPWSAIDRVQFDDAGAMVALFPRMMDDAPFVAPIAAFGVSASVLAGRINIWREAARLPRRTSQRPALALVPAKAEATA